MVAHPDFATTKATPRGQKEETDHPCAEKLSRILHLMKQHHSDLSFRPSKSDIICDGSTFWKNGKNQSYNFFREHIEYKCYMNKMWRNFEMTLTIRLGNAKLFNNLKYEPDFFTAIRNKPFVVFVDNHTGSQNQVKHNHILWQLNLNPFAVNFETYEQVDNGEVT